MNIANIPVTMDELVALWKLRHGEVNGAGLTISRHRACPTAERMAEAILSSPVTPAVGKFRYNILGEQRSANSSVAAFLDVLSTLSSLEPNLPARLSLIAPANTRNHVARSPAEVYPERPDLGRKSREFAPGWYVGTNIADREKQRILRLACSISGLQFGKDVIF